LAAIDASATVFALASADALLVARITSVSVGLRPDALKNALGGVNVADEVCTGARCGPSAEKSRAGQDGLIGGR
jgi:hypothetical protein